MVGSVKPKKINRKIVVYGFFTILAISILSMFWTLGGDLGAEKQRQEEMAKAEQQRLEAMNTTEVSPEDKAKEAMAEAQKEVGVPVSSGGALPPPPAGLNEEKRRDAMMRLVELEKARNEVSKTAPSDKDRTAFGVSDVNAAGAPDHARGGARSGFVVYAADPEGAERRFTLKMKETEEYEKRLAEQRKKKERVEDDFAKGNGSLHEHNDRVTEQQTVTATRVNGTHWLAAGTIIRAVLINDLDTATPGNVTARVIEDVYDSRYGRYVVIPAGSTVIGSYSSKVDYYHERVSTQFQTLITPAGANIPLRSVFAGDKMGVAGIPGELHTHFVKRAIATLAGAVAADYAYRKSSKNTTTTTQGGMTTTTTQSPAADIVVDAAKREIERYSAEPWNVTAEAGQVVTITLTESIEIPPVANRR